MPRVWRRSVAAPVFPETAATPQVEVLAVDFRKGRVDAARLQIASDRARHFDHPELRASKRFDGPPYMTAVLSADSNQVNVVSRIPEPLSADDVNKARQLAAALWKLRCPRSANLPPDEICQWDSATGELVCRPVVTDSGSGN